MTKKILELSEYQTKSPTGEYPEREEDTLHGEDDTLKNLELMQEDLELRSYLRKKGILYIKELKTGLEISSTSSIGVVHFSNFVVKVLPKFSLDPSSLPKMIAYAFKLEDIVIPNSKINFQANDEYLMDIIISFFVLRCQQLLREGLLKTYVTYQDDVKFLRGKILLKNQIMHVVKHRLFFSCEFDELEHDNLENQILLFTLNQSYRLTRSDDLKKRTRQLIRQFSDSIEQREITSDDFNRINYTRLNKHYKGIHELCELIISATGISDFYQDQKHSISSFFVDMNMVFEKFITRLFQEYYSTDFLVEEQKGKRAWVTEGDASSYIRTDILLTNPEGKKTVIDVKYKRKLSREDWFQIFFYAHEYKQSTGFAVLPFYSDSKDQTMVSVVSGVTIEIKRLNIEDVLNKLYSENTQKEKILQDIVTKLVPL